MEGMDIEVIGRTHYTVHLTDNDIEKVKQYIKTNKDTLYGDMENMVCEAVKCLYSDGQIELFERDKATESDFETEEINWSGFERRSAETILGISLDDIEDDEE